MPTKFVRNDIDIHLTVCYTPFTTTKLRRMDLSKASVNKLRTELWTCHILCEQRCLRKACEWAEDLLYALPEEGEEKLLSKLEKDLNDVTTSFNPQYEYAKACFELHEYDRAAHLVKDLASNDDKARFLHYFAMYKAAEKKRIDLMNEINIIIPKKAMLKFNELRDSLERSMDKRPPDGWLLYVYGLVLHKFKLQKYAIKILEKAINMTPVNWSAWHILATIIDNKSVLHQLTLPHHLFRVFFYYQVRSDLDMAPSDPWIFVGNKDTKNFLDKYFKSSLYIKTVQARALGYQTNKHREAMDLFHQIMADDPYRVDAMEVYSNVLYNRRLRKDLAKLAYDVERIDPFTSEANSCIANSFSARDQHHKSVVYFTRALSLNPDHHNSWTLIGHEYLELKSIEKALQAYRFAISINKRDGRAWLGLGQTYETIMSVGNVTNPNYEICLYYYAQMGKYRPKDVLMYPTMSCIYEKMGDIQEAVLCLKKAGNTQLHRLAKLCESNGLREEAAEAYQKWLNHLDEFKGNPRGAGLLDQSGNGSTMFQSTSMSLVDQSSSSPHKQQHSMISDFEGEISYAKRYIAEVINGETEEL